MPIFRGMSEAQAQAYRAGALDANGQPPEHQVSDGTAPCRCCLRLIAEGAPMLVLAHRPFQDVHPYAEVGPIFLCADTCAPEPREMLEILTSPDYLLKGYSSDERIVYGTGRITPVDEISSYADDLLSRDDIAFVDLRSAQNNCWQARLTKD